MIVPVLRMRVCAFVYIVTDVLFGTRAGLEHDLPCCLGRRVPPL